MHSRNACTAPTPTTGTEPGPTGPTTAGTDPRGGSVDDLELTDLDADGAGAVSVNWPESAPPPVTSRPTVHVRIHLDAGEALPTEAGDVVRQGEDLGRWVRTVQ
ncbi:hypothetical protein [Streptomyces flaveolus]|uniref:hypothetical protein n=1 Tax=Streptomyces flaveolus TaxID=67297 RepID=UPI003F4DB69D